MAFLIPLLRGLSLAARSRFVTGARVGSRVGSLRRSTSLLQRPSPYLKIFEDFVNGADRLDEVIHTVEGVVYIGSRLFDRVMKSEGSGDISFDISEILMVYDETEGLASKTASSLALSAMIRGEAMWPMSMCAAVYPGRNPGLQEEAAAYVTALLNYYNHSENYAKQVLDKTDKRFETLAKFKSASYNYRTWGQVAWNWTAGWIGYPTTPYITNGDIMKEVIQSKQLLDLGGFVHFLHMKYESAINDFNTRIKAAGGTIIERYDAIGIIRFVTEHIRTIWANDRILVISTSYTAGTEEWKTVARRCGGMFEAVIMNSIAHESSSAGLIHPDVYVSRLDKVLQDSRDIINPCARNDIYEYLVSSAEKFKRDML